MWTNWSTNDGALVTTIESRARPRLTRRSGRSPRWAPVALDPGKSYKLAPKHAPTKTIDIRKRLDHQWYRRPGVRQLGRPPGQKLVLKDAGKGNVKLTMKANTNKCLGPRATRKTAGTKLEVQDCNGGDDQAFITGETAAGSGVFMLKVVGAPGLCVDVAGAGTANGTAMDILPLHRRRQPAVQHVAVAVTT